MEKMIETEILVVGGGPAGASAARYLAKGGKDTILIQRHLAFKKPCGGGLRMDAFETFELDHDLIQKRVNTITLVYKDKRVLVDISHAPLAIVDRVAFDTALREKAVQAGAQLYEARWIDCEIFDTHIVSKIKQADRYVFVRSRYLIAADGVNSKIRQRINKDHVPSLLTCYADIHSQSYDTCAFHFGSKVAGQYYAWAFPHAQGANIGTVVGCETTLTQLKAQLHIDTPTKNRGYAIPEFENNLFYKNRVFFVGDSASQVLPFTFEGIYYAMASAKILADVVSEDQAPKEYEKRWNEHYAKVFMTLRRLQKIFLYNDFMIAIMMRLFKHRYIQKQMVELWRGKRDVTLDFGFFIRVLKRLLLRD
ncbi:geranylgeranyl reductase family protein [Sulfurospirillum sp. 1612]|uniref:geranylgeranyl reductase family protein n=1 Tax=Sulfurospirillum sp. 1612 TaxID=3094835 RepID=UPI002F94B0A5